MGKQTGLVLLGVSGVLSYTNTARLIETSRWVANTHAAIDKQGELLARLTEAETGIFGCVITGDAIFLEPHSTETHRINSLLKDLRTTHCDDSEQLKRLDHPEPLVTTRLVLIENRIAIRNAQGFEATAELI